MEVRGVLANNVQIPLDVRGVYDLSGGKTGVYVALPDDWDAAEIERLTLERQDLVLLVGRLIHRMRAARDGRGIAAGDDALEQQALGYLRRKGLTSPLRDEGPNYYLYAAELLAGKL